MKSIYLLLSLSIFFLSTKLKAQQTIYIPDDNFEQALIDLGYDNFLDNYVETSNIVGVTNLDIRFKGISDLTGIESFTGLILLNCTFNSITNLDLTLNTNLKELYCNANNIRSLDLSKNTALTYLDCGFNKLDELYLRDNKALTVLYCDYNNLVSLDVKNGNNTNFTYFDASKNPNLNCIEVDNTSYSSTNWLNKDSTSNYCNEESVDITYIPDNNFEQALIALGYDDVLDDYVSTSNISGVTVLNVSNKGIADLTGIEAFTNLITLNCSRNNLTNLDVSQNKVLAYLSCPYNQLSDLDVSNNTELLELYCAVNKITNLDLSQNKALTKLFSWVNQHTSLDLSQNAALTHVICYTNKLTSVNLKNGTNTNIINFNITDNPDLVCIEVDNVPYSATNWLNKDAASSYSIDCGIISASAAKSSNSKSSNSEELSTTSLSTNQSEIINYKLYPNPVKDILNITLYYGVKIIQVNFYNAYGQRIYSVAKTTRIDVNNFHSGIYFVEIETNKGKSTQKIIVN